MKVLIPGSFDPVTVGHAALIRRAAALFGEVVVCVFDNGEKNCLFTAEERLAMLRLVCEKIPGAAADRSSGFLADYAAEHGIHVLVKGTRNTADYDYEQWLYEINRHYDPEMETVILPSESELSFVSSTVVREYLKYGKSLHGLVPEAVAAYIRTIRN